MARGVLFWVSYDDINCTHKDKQKIKSLIDRTRLNTFSAITRIRTKHDTTRVSAAHAQRLRNLRGSTGNMTGGPRNSAVGKTGRDMHENIHQYYRLDYGQHKATIMKKKTGRIGYNQQAQDSLLDG
jgi:hypothetical protein